MHVLRDDGDVWTAVFQGDNAADYLHQREQRRAVVRRAVSIAIGVDCLRGSWAAGDFHLDRVDNSSFSDVDLAHSNDVPVSDAALRTISEVLSTEGFVLRVSAHKEEALACVTPHDGRILKIAEYLAHVRSLQSSPRHMSYWRAKTALLLLRAGADESYTAIARRMGTGDAFQALAVKLGVEQIFGADRAARLVGSSNEDVVREFVDKCILSDPELAYRDDVVARIRQCKSFSSWLRDYMLAKMGAVA